MPYKEFFKIFSSQLFQNDRIPTTKERAREIDRQTERQTDRERETEVYLSSPLDCDFKVSEHPLKARNLPNSPEQHSSSFRHYLEDFY